jgi:hypothetical protein
MTRLTILLAVLLLPQTQRASIEGSVVFLPSGTPAAAASVELTVIEGARVVSRTAVTGRNGQFSFRDLPPGTGYQLVATGTGFRATAYGQRDSRSPWTPLTLEAGQRLTDVQITVQPVSQLGGRVIDRSGKTLTGASVLAMKPVYVDGRRQLQRAAATVTNLRGEYRFFSLPSGPYYIRVSRLNDAAIEPLFNNPALYDRTAPTQRRSTVSREPEGFRTVYHPGVSMESAKAVVVGDGQILNDIDVTVTKAPTSRVRGTVIEDSSSRRMVSAQVSLVPAGSSPDSNWSRFLESTDGAFDFRAVLAGEYYLSAVVRGPEGVLARRMLVNIRSGEPAAFDVRVTPVGTISGRLTVEGLNTSVPNLSSLRVRLSSNLQGPLDREQSQPPLILPSFTTEVRTDGAFTLARVLPGDYRVDVFPFHGGYIKSVRLGNAEALDEGLRVDDSSNTLEIVLGTDTGSLNGRVRDGKGQNVRSARVVLVPQARQRHDLYHAVPVSETGRFQMSGIAPGRYSLYAWEGAPEGAWKDPDFLELYRKHETKVEISPETPEYAEITIIPL